MKVAELQRLNNALPLKNRPVDDVKSINQQPAGKVEQQNTRPFGQVLQTKLDEQQLRFSAHALHRMDERNINLSQSDIKRLSEGVERARAKGSRDSLVLMDEMAYIVSVKNHTVITALTKEMSKDNVYTNIDSVSIV
jgi:flagellar operon protein